MIDWLTLSVDVGLLDPAVRAVLEHRGDWIVRHSGDGELRWRTKARESLRSDSHQVVIAYGSSLSIMGSPARVGQGNNVFGSDDVRECALRMIRFVASELSIVLPSSLSQWKCTRIDVTENFDLGGSAEVMQALQFLRHAEGGRYQLRTQSDTVYWSQGSSLRSGKAYAKGPHLARQVRRGEAYASAEQIEVAHRILRLELSLRSQFFRERTSKKWHQFTPDDLAAMHAEYFGQFIGADIGNCVEVAAMENELMNRLRALTTKGQAESAYRTWALMKAIGPREARASMNRATWFRHKKLLRSAGLTDADMQARNIVPFRKRALILSTPVKSWEQLQNVA